MNKPVQPKKPVATTKSTKPLNKPSNTSQQPLILPRVPSNQGSSKEVVGASSFVTQTWTIPDRPKPGRKPKQQKPCPESKQQAHSYQQDVIQIDGPVTSSTAKNKPPSVTLREIPKKSKDFDTTTSSGALQQAYINSLEAKVQSLQSQESEQVNYYKALASQSTAKLDSIQNENNALQSQIKILRAEVSGLRKRVSQLIKKPTTDNQLEPIIVEDESSPKESKVRKQVSPPDPDSSCSLERIGTSAKKPRRPSMHDEVNVSTSTSMGFPETFNSPQITSEIPTVENTVTLAPGSSNPINKRVPDFTSSDIYCGLCTSELDCVCRQVGLKPPLQSVNFSMKDFGGPLAVPIRRRAQPSTSSVWRIVTTNDSAMPSPASPETEPVLARECNGNPKDCPACRDDPFGQAFCAALNQATATQEPISNSEASTESTTGIGGVPTRKMQRSDPIVDAYMSIPCCGDPELCGSQNCFDNVPSLTPVEEEIKVPCSEAWRQLKAHPNIGLANLQLLADVVARKSTTGHLSSSSSSSVEQNSSSIYHLQNQSHDKESSSSSSWPPHSMLENEDSVFSPHLTLSTVFENTHNDFDEEEHHHHHHPQDNNPSFHATCSSSTNSLTSASHIAPLDTGYSHLNPHLQHHNLSSSSAATQGTSSSTKKVKFVVKESLDQALRMLDRAI
ncbi:hypothetical protein MJO29_004070 [Puccinia striiformis f. sp. tritici]|nr:hypothetical protein MJO29_004070 [Puccinia striiformis f. sp. tritici]